MSLFFIIIVLVSRIYSSIDWYDDLFINKKIEYAEGKSENKAGYYLKNVVGLKKNDFEYKGLVQDLYFDFHFNTVVSLKADVEKKSTSLLYEYYDRFSIKSKQEHYRVSSVFEFRYDPLLIVSLNEMFSLNENGIDDFDFGIKSKWIGSEFIEPEISASYFEYNLPILIDHEEFPNGEIVDVNLSKRGYDFSISTKVFFLNHYSVKPIFYKEILTDENEKSGYQIGQVGDVSWYGLEFIFDKVSVQKMNLGYFNSNNKTEGLRYSDDEVKRYHYSRFEISYLSAEYSFAYKPFNELSLSYVGGVMVQDTVPDFIEERKELLSYNRLFPAGLDLIVGSSWYNYSAANKLKIPFCIIAQKTNYELKLFRYLNLNLLYEHYIIDASVKGQWFEIEKQFFNSNINTYEYEVDVFSYLQKIEMQWSLNLAGGSQLGFDIGQLFLISKRFDDHQSTTKPDQSNGGPGGDNGSNGDSIEKGPDEEYDEFKWPSGFSFKVEYLISF